MDSVVAWLVYLLGVGLIGLCLWRFSRAWSPGFWRSIFRWLPAVLLLVPTRADLAQTELAPALFVAMFEYGMSSDPAAGAVALQRIAYALAGLFLLLLIAAIRRRRV